MAKLRRVAGSGVPARRHLLGALAELARGRAHAIGQQRPRHSVAADIHLTKGHQGCSPRGTSARQGQSQFQPLRTTSPTWRKNDLETRRRGMWPVTAPTKNRGSPAAGDTQSAIVTTVTTA